MVQVPKEHVRTGIVSAAAELFAEHGYEATTISAVAERAGTSTGNVYKYFEGKGALFDAVLPASFARDVKRMTRARIEALGTGRDTRKAPERYVTLAGELLELCLAHRERVVILLARAEGTPFASFARDFVDELVKWALDYARNAWPDLEQSAELRFSLRCVYAAFLRSIAEAFMTFRKEADLRAVVAHLTAHHQGGLKHLFETADEAR